MFKCNYATDTYAVQQPTTLQQLMLMDWILTTLSEQTYQISSLHS